MGVTSESLVSPHTMVSLSPILLPFILSFLFTVASPMSRDRMARRIHRKKLPAETRIQSREEEGHGRKTKDIDKILKEMSVKMENVEKDLALMNDVMDIIDEMKVKGRKEINDRATVREDNREDLIDREEYSGDDMEAEEDDEDDYEDIDGR